MRTSTIAETVRRTATRVPNSTAITFDDREWSYQELDHAVTRVTQGLHRQGVTKGDRVAAYGRNSDMYVLLFLATARLGAIHVPVNFQLHGDELDYILSDSDPILIIADRELADAITQTKSNRDRHVLLFEEEILAWALMGDDDRLRDDAFAVEDTDVAQLLYTSGTTSDPKGAIMTHRALIYRTYERESSLL